MTASINPTMNDLIKTIQSNLNQFQQYELASVIVNDLGGEIIKKEIKDVRQSTNGGYNE